MIFLASIISGRRRGRRLGPAGPFFAALFAIASACFGIQTHPGFASDALHVVKKGETLSDIALKHEISVRQIMDWNNFTSAAIFQGQRLAVTPSGWWKFMS